jgi:hypothetical protein
MEAVALSGHLERCLEWHSSERDPGEKELNSKEQPQNFPTVACPPFGHETLKHHQRINAMEEIIISKHAVFPQVLNRSPYDHQKRHSPLHQVAQSSPPQQYIELGVVA